MAGTGKSTLLRTIAQQVDKLGRLGGSFFFYRRGDADLKEAKKVLPTLAYQLAKFDRGFAHRLTEALGGGIDVCHESYKRQAEKLFIEPAKGLVLNKGPILLVLDALDECEEEGLKALLPVVLAAIRSSSAHIKLLVATRPEPYIKAILTAPSTHNSVVLHDIEGSVVRDDIARYLNTRLTDIPDEVGRDMEKPWFKREELDLLVAACGLLFVYASTALLFIGDKSVTDPRRQLNTLLTIDTTTSTTVNRYTILDCLYSEVLGHGIPRNNVYVLDRFRRVIGTLVLLRDTLTIREIAALMKIDAEDVKAALNRLHSVILMPKSVDGVAVIYHKSFEDYIISPDRCPLYYVDVAEHHASLAGWCLQVILDSLPNHTSDRKPPGYIRDGDKTVRQETKTDAISPWLKYACIYLAVHIKATPMGDTRTIALLVQFLERGILWWFEILCILKRVDTAARSAKEVEEWAVSQPV